jgi:hypothetical protein
VGRHHANRGWGYIQFFGDQVVHLRGRFEATNAIDAERPFKPPIDARVL